MSSGEPVKFVPVSSAVDVMFWQKLSEMKLNVWKLGDGSVPIEALRSLAAPSSSSPLQLTHEAFLSADKKSLSAARGEWAVRGELKNYNTMEGFKAEKWQEVADTVGRRIWDAIESGEAEKHPELLSQFRLCSHADIKKWVFTYWFCFPTLVAAGTGVTFDAAACPVDQVTGSSERTKQLQHAVEALAARCRADPAELGSSEFFIVHVPHDAAQPPEAGLLRDFQSWKTGERAQSGQILLGFADSSNLPANPSGSVRNLLVLAAHKWGLAQAKVLCLRESLSRDGDISGSVVLSLRLPELPQGCAMPQVTGWEANAKGRPSPRLVDLSAIMDSQRLAEESVDLNLKLMKWRLVPNIDLETIGQQKCLLLGAGTLGCNVARTLMAWGVRHITFVDNSKVSYSNPVRQSLFTFRDCQDGSRPKAEVAAERLRDIFPAMVSEGHNMSIPMAGHAVGTAEQRAEVERDVKRLEDLMKAHTIVFLLTDSRESRWLPTLLGQVHRIPVVNAAMGFDSFLVMRHGIPSDDASAPKHGCYFCSDVVAPVDSLSNRSLDQQCTVTRPGLSFLCSATCVELTIGALQHPQKFLAPSDSALPTSEKAPRELGLLPQHIRGFLTHFHQYLGAVHKNPYCTGCAPIIVDEYKKRGTDFVLQVMNSPTVLEDMTGLTAMNKEAEAALARMEELDFDNDDDDDGFEQV